MNTKMKEMQEDIELLLPWHAAGTLSRRDAIRVEQALANDNELASRYELVREELGEAIRLNESLGAPSARAMEKLFAKIDAEPARKPKVSFNLSVWLTDFVASFQPRTLAYGATAAALAIVLSVFFGLGMALLVIVQQLPTGNAAGLMFYIYGKAASMTAGEIMVPAERVITVLPGTPLLEATRAMTEQDVHQLPVVQDGRMVGVLNRGDILAQLEVRQRLGRQAPPTLPR